MMNARLVYEVRGMRADGSVACQSRLQTGRLRSCEIFWPRGTVTSLCAIQTDAKSLKPM